MISKTSHPHAVFHRHVLPLVCNRSILGRNTTCLSNCQATAPQRKDAAVVRWPVKAWKSRKDDRRPSRGCFPGTMVRVRQGRAVVVGSSDPGADLPICLRRLGGLLPVHSMPTRHLRCRSSSLFTHDALPAGEARGLLGGCAMEPSMASACARAPAKRAGSDRCRRYLPSFAAG